MTRHPLETGSDAQPAALASGAPRMRRATRDDLPDIIQLLIDGAVAGSGIDTLDEVARPIYLKAFDAIDADPDEMLFVAEFGGRVVGTLQITFCQSLVNRARLRATLESVHVAPDMRGKGVGAVMVLHAVEVARTHGAGIVQLTSNKQRVDAHRFYERLGFKRSHEGFKLEF